MIAIVLPLSRDFWRMVGGTIANMIGIGGDAREKRKRDAHTIRRYKWLDPASGGHLYHYGTPATAARWLEENRRRVGEIE